MIAEIYQKQLETILFSVNQYSDDALNSWISKTQSYFDSGDDSDRNEVPSKPNASQFTHSGDLCCG